MSHTPDADLVELIAAMEKCRESNHPDGVRTCLAAAATLVEHAAYELARAPQASHVSSLILVSAELERISRSLPDVTEAA